MKAVRRSAGACLALVFFVGACLVGVRTVLDHRAVPALAPGEPVVFLGVGVGQGSSQGEVERQSQALGQGQGQEPWVSAAAAVLIEASTGTVLFGRNADQTRDPASITKVMTAIIAIERGDLADVVTVSARAAAVPGSTLGLRAGEQIKLEELIRATMLRSGNDGATAIAEHIGGTVEQFVDMMNARARSMGLTRTRFANPHGLTAPGHYRTARDIARMCAYGLSIPKFAEIVGCTELWATRIDGDQVKGATLVHNTNRLLWSYQGADGVKTGTTSAAGHCLAASATRDGLQLIAVVLKSGARFRDAAALLDYGFNNFRRHDIALAGHEVASALVERGVVPSVGLATAGPVRAVVRVSEAGRLRTVVDCPARPQAPVRTGQHLGWLRVFVDDEEVEAYPLYATADVGRRWGLW